MRSASALAWRELRFLMLVSRRLSPAARVLFCLLCAGFAMGWLAAPVDAGSGDVHTLPQSGLVKLKSKLRLKVDTRWVDGTGYRPIVIEAIPTPGPAATDRQIRVTLRPMGQSQRETSTLIDIPQGSRSASKVVLVPQDEMWHNMGVTVHEGGARIDELSIDYLSFTRTNYWNWTEASPATLFIDADVPPRAQRDVLVGKFRATASDPKPTHSLPDYRNFVRTFPESNYANMMIAPDGSQKVGDIDLLSQMNDVARSELLPLGELPERWLELTMFDLAFVSYGDLQSLAKDHPQRFEALREWLQAGGVLCVYGVGEKFERLADLERRLKLAERPRARSQKEAYRGWIEPDFSKRFLDLSQMAYGAQGYDNNYAEALSAQMPALNIEIKKDGDKPPKTWPFLARDAGLGYVVAIADDNPFPGKRSDWTWMLSTIPNDHWMWFRRNGMSMHRTNNDFWNFLIPGVGVAPVVSFLLLITLFAAVIGPVNYLLLGRWRRLYLLLITVPVGAAVVTCSLFLYALATDGIGVRARLRSFTELDARAGHAVSWSRQSYYASIAPSKGLNFPEDTAVYPLVHEPTSRSGTRSWGQELHWDEGQHLQAGYLPSRSAAQFLVVRAAPTQSRLIVQPQVGGKGPRVKNELGTDIPYLVIADRQSKEEAASSEESNKTASADGTAPAYLTPRTYWQVESLASGAIAEAKVVSAEEVRRRLNDVYRDNAPAYPEGYDPTLHNNAMDFLNNTYTRYVNVDPGHGMPTVASSALERNLSRLAARSDAMLEPGAFLAITGSPPEVPLGVEEMRQDQSLHVVHGRW